MIIFGFILIVPLTIILSILIFHSRFFYNHLTDSKIESYLISVLSGLLLASMIAFMWPVLLPAVLLIGLSWFCIRITESRIDTIFSKMKRILEIIKEKDA